MIIYRLCGTMGEQEPLKKSYTVRMGHLLVAGRGQVSNLVVPDLKDVLTFSSLA